MKTKRSSWQRPLLLAGIDIEMESPRAAVGIQRTTMTTESMECDECAKSGTKHVIGRGPGVVCHSPLKGAPHGVASCCLFSSR
jgi:hypothetical protein